MAAPAAYAQGDYYTTAQAKRGEALFDRHCIQCHSRDAVVPGQPRPPANGRGFWTGDSKVWTSLATPYLQTTYQNKPVFPSVYFLYRRMEGQPATNVDSITFQQRVDITAFILQINGQPAGPAELPANLPAMRSMPLNEDGFTLAFNGRDFTGLKFLLGPNCRPAPGGCGKTDPAPVFSVKDGVLHSNARVHGYWYFDQQYLNFTLRFEYRFDVAWPREDEDLFVGNSGTLLFVRDHMVWPRGIEIDGAHRTLLRANALNTRAKATEDDEARRRARRPIGEWQSVEIVSKAGAIRASVNGTLVTTVSEHEFKEPGSICFQVQGTPIEWRNIRIKAD